MGKKQLCLIFTIYLIIAVVGSFSLSIGETFRFAESGDNLAHSGGIFTTISLNIDCLAEETVTAGKTNIAFLTPGMKNNKTALSFSFQTANEYHAPVSKSKIPIKLRI